MKVKGRRCPDGRDYKKSRIKLYFQCGTLKKVSQNFRIFEHKMKIKYTGSSWSLVYNKKCVFS